MMAKMLMIMLMSILMNNNNPMMMTATVSLLMCLMSSEMYQMSMSSWLSMMTIMLVAGGLMILYVFVICMSPNEKMKSSHIMMSMITMMFTMTVFNKCKMNNSWHSKNMNMYKMEWSLMVVMLLIIIIYMMMMSKIVKSKNKSIKSFK